MKVSTEMDDSRHRENGRLNADLYRSIHTQWMIPQYQNQMRDNQAVKLMSAMSERDKAIQERNIALSEKRRAVSERDMAIIRRDAAVAERDTAIMERDNAIAALNLARENSINLHGHSTHALPASRGPKHIHDYQNHSVMPSLSNDNNSQEMHVTVEETQKVKRQKKETSSKDQEPKKTKSVKGNINKKGIYVKPLNAKHHNEWKDQDLGLNQIRFDESTMPVPVCSCTGKYHQCYKWGEGGWQSACCTTTLSMYPLPVLPNKKHGRLGGRKMSGTVFNKLLNKLAADGHDLSVAIDLRYHWAKHGTNRYITIK